MNRSVFNCLLNVFSDRLLSPRVVSENFNYNHAVAYSRLEYSLRYSIEYSSGKKVDSHSASESVKRKYYVTLRTTSQSLIQKLLASVEFDAVCCKKS